MPREQSDATKIRTLKAEVTRLDAMRNALTTQRDYFRARATKAEQEAAEWKTRFDILLRREGLT